MRTKDLSYIALFAGITAALGLVPAVQIGPVPITAQTLGVMLAGSVLGARRGFLALLLFLLLVVVGLPVLPGGHGGVGVFAGPTAGYLVGWPIGAGAVGLMAERVWVRYNLAWGVVANVLGGMVVVYVIGVPVLAAITHLSLWAAIASGVLPFLIGDLIKAVTAAAIAVQVRRSYPVIERPRRVMATQ